MAEWGYPMASGHSLLPWSLVPGFFLPARGTPQSSHRSCIKSCPWPIWGLPLTEQDRVPSPHQWQSRGAPLCQPLYDRIPIPLWPREDRVPLPSRTGYPAGGTPLSVMQEDFVVKRFFEYGIIVLISNFVDLVPKKLKSDHQNIDDRILEEI